jgi:hypothetical protein
MIDLQISVDDFEWRIQTLYALYRKIIQFKRTRTSGTVVASLGTLAYAQAFKRICEHALRKSTKKLPNYDDEALRSSLDAAQAELTLQYEKSARRRDICLNWLVGIIGLIFSLVSLLSLHDTKIPGGSAESLKFLAYLVTNYPIYTISIIGVAIIYFAVDLENTNFSRNLVRVLQSGDRRWVILGLLLTALFIFMFIYLLFYIL